jgi:hypothetical protein
MSVLSGSRLAVFSAMAAVPAVLLVTACGNSTSPKAVPTADTVAVNANAFIIEKYDSTYYYTDATQDDDEYVEIDNDDDYREIMQYTLPALRGQRVVDSASVFEYVCDNEVAVGKVTPGPHATALAKRNAARRARTGFRLGALDAQPAIMLEHLHYSQYVEASAWGADLMGTGTTLIGPNDVSLGWKEASVTANVKADYAAGNANSQYRIQYSFNPDNGEYYVDFGAQDCDDNNGVAGGSYMVVWSH